MNRWLLLGSLAALLIGSTGCSLHNSCRNDCSTGCGDCTATTDCGNQNYCGNGCNSGHCGDGCEAGPLKRFAGLWGLHPQAACPTGCEAGKLGWQQGGHRYSSFLHPGPLGQTAARQIQSRPYYPGPATSQVAYPYYTHRGPRDFLMDNPPSIGR